MYSLQRTPQGMAYGIAQASHNYPLSLPVPSIPSD